MAKILVVGAGALGSLLGARLHEAGHDARLVGRGEHARRLATDGLRLEGGAYGRERLIAVPAAERAPPGFAPDLVVLAVKTQDVEGALAQHAAALSDAPIVALQNGLAQDALVARAVGEARAVACIAALEATCIEPGRVACAREGALVLGGSDAPSVDTAASILRDAIDVRLTREPTGARWTKLLVNLGNVVPALTGLSFQEAAAHPGLARAHVRLVKEGLRVARAEQVRIAPIPYTSPRLLRLAAHAPEALAARIYGARTRRVLGDAPAYGSTWQSLRRGASIETEWLNGEIARRGRAHGMPTPANTAAVALMQKGANLSGDEAALALR
jgi:2-dehydropantoate 2-reductase